jgi:tRNA(Ile)-lysidine synthase
VAEALARTAGQLRDDGDALDAAAAALLADARGGSHTPPEPRTPLPAGPVCGAPDLDAAVLAGAPAAVRRRALRGWLLAGGVAGLTDGHLRSADDLVGRWRGQGAVALPHRLEVLREHGRLRMRAAAWPRAE